MIAIRTICLAVCAFLFINEGIHVGGLQLPKSRCARVWCQGKGIHRSKCNVRGAAAVYSVSLLSEYSRKACPPKNSIKNYGKFGDYMWAKNDCRAYFRVCYRPKPERKSKPKTKPKSKSKPKPSTVCDEKVCKRENDKHARCRVDGYITSAKVIKKYSGDTSRCAYRKAYADLRISKGCHARFRICYKEPTASRIISCSSSINDEWQKCRANIDRISYGVIKGKFSTSKCDFGRTYRFKENYVWVKKGCSAMFKVYQW